MVGFASPDLPAYWCYAIVLAVGALVSATVVNQLLSQYPDRWAFAGTLLLFGAHTLIPVALFWFLDYVGALHDTSLFGALVVAVGYRQIFAGGIQGITMPGQTPRLWQPFEAWVKQVADRVQLQQKIHLDRFTEAVKSYIRDKPERIETFENLLCARTRNYESLEKRLCTIRDMPAAAGIQARVLDELWSELRMSEPDNWGYLLSRQKLIPLGRYWLYLRNGRSKLASAAIVMLIAGALWFGLSFVLRGESKWITAYHHWRLTKVTATDRDRFRTYRTLRDEVRGAVAATKTSSAVPNEPNRIHGTLVPLITTLKYRELAAQQADDILRLIVDVHSVEVDAVVIPDLIDALRTENPYTRAAIQKVLLGLQKADFPAALPSQELSAWTPSKDDTSLTIDDHVRKWLAWWNAANPHPIAPSNSPTRASS